MNYVIFTAIVTGIFSIGSVLLVHLLGPKKSYKEDGDNRTCNRHQ